MKPLSSISVKPEARREGDIPANLTACGRAAHAIGRYAATKRSFTLVEMMVSMALLVILAYILLQITTLVASTNARVSGGVNSFQDASVAFDTLTKTLSQATLNTYIDYYPSQLGSTMNDSAGTAPSIYIRQSELHFVCGQAVNLVSSSATSANNPTHAVFFQAPLGYSATYASPPIPDLLNACGFYIQFSDNYSLNMLPSFLPKTSPSNLYRYRLMEMLQPSENLGVYTDPALASPTKGSILPSSPADSGISYYNWITTATSGATSSVYPIADNIIALIIQPMLDPADLAYLATLSPAPIFPTNLNRNSAASFDYTYDTRRDAISIATTPYQQLEQSQLPPLMQVTMVAIDEPSAIRLEAQNNNTCPNLVASAGATLFTKTGNYATDLNTLTAYLTTKHIKYRVFTAQVPMFNAKWTTQ